MSLAAGHRIGAYEIVSPIGAGGMGEVYRARDTRLGRDVAIKILPEVFATDPERVGRFHREAELLASRSYGLTRDGNSFVMLTSVDDETAALLDVVINWPALLTRR